MTDYTDPMLIVLLPLMAFALIAFLIYHPRKTLICLVWMVVIVVGLMEVKRMIKP